MSATAVMGATMNSETKNHVAETSIRDSHLSPPVCGPLAPYDRRGTRDFYRYYHPFQALSDRQPAWVDLNDAAAVAAHVAQASPDKALTAFCQLVAVKLRVRRAMLFFFDDHFGYILAEATCSLSLQRETVHDPGDALWLGHAKIPKGFSVCEHTVNLPANKGSNETAFSSSRVHIINNLQKDARFQHRPYVTSGPLARFYAGVPIKTPAGFNIGALCALDTETRMGLSDGEVDFLTDMAATIMDHLEALRARAEYKRGMQMIAGLSAFVQGTAVDPSITSDTNKPPIITASTSPSKTIQPGSDVLSRDENACPVLLEPLNSNPSDLVTSELIGEEISSLPEQVSKIEEQIAPSDAQQPRLVGATEIRDTPRVDPRTSANKPFLAAASIIQKALDLDGVLFFDTSVNTFGGLAEEPRRASIQDGWDSCDSVATNDIGSDHSQAPRIANGSRVAKSGLCNLLAAAHADDSDTHLPTISQKTLRALCRRYPRGHIWSFNCDDPASSASEASSTSPPSASFNSEASAGSHNQKFRRQLRRRSQYKELADLIPSVQSLALVPLRDFTSDEWRAGAVLYSFSPQRTFSPEGELNFMAAFGDVLIAELARSETQVALQAKSAFTSSLSHELRTPLHGILGTVEQLYEETSPSVAAKMVSQIEICGRTLLDVINHLLDFSQVSEEAGNSTHNVTSDASISDADDPSHSANRSLQKQLASSIRQVALDHVTTEVIEACILSHRSTFNSATLGDPGVTTTVQITPNHKANWSVEIHEGAWKRICMNVVSNALKFTESGHVSISLKQKNLRRGKGKVTAILCVEDSGRGMCEDYMFRSLFRPFTQEDTFVPGAGLGMSIVAKLVRSLGGKLDVQSRPGTGTKVTVEIPLKVMDKTGLPCRTISHGVRGRATALILGKWLAEGSTPVTHGRFLLCTRIEETLGELGLTVQRDGDASAAAFVVLLEDDLLSILNGTVHYETTTSHTNTLPLVGTALMLICKTHASARKLETKHSHQSNHHISFVPEPYSPNQIAEAVAACAHPREHSRPDNDAKGQHARRPLLHRAPSSTQNSQKNDQNQYKSTSVAKRFDFSSPLTETSPTTEAQSTNGQKLVRSDSQVPSEGPNSPSSPQKDPLTNTFFHHIPETRREALRILIVDDNDINLRLLSTYCQKQGYGISTATDGAQAVEQYEQAVLAQATDDVASRYTIQGDQILRVSDRPHAILMDINMPVMDGFAAAQAVRAFEKKMALENAVLIIAMTGLSSAKAKQQAFASGIDLFFSKPVKLRELSKVLAKRFPL